MDVDFNDYRDIQKNLGGHFEIVQTTALRRYFYPRAAILADEDGNPKGLPLNVFATELAETAIVGDVLLCEINGEDMAGIRSVATYFWGLKNRFPKLKRRGDEI